jgi:hypothetical protein
MNWKGLSVIIDIFEKQILLKPCFHNSDYEKHNSTLSCLSSCSKYADGSIYSNFRANLSPKECQNLKGEVFSSERRHKLKRFRNVCLETEESY